MNNDWLLYADGDHCFANWLCRLDEICDRFLNIRFQDLLENGEFDVHDAYRVQKCKPEQFLKECVIPYVEIEHGAEFIYSHLADNVMWGFTNEGCT